jgi:hypothetical protein
MVPYFLLFVKSYQSVVTSWDGSIVDIMVAAGGIYLHV